MPFILFLPDPPARAPSSVLDGTGDRLPVSLLMFETEFSPVHCCVCYLWAGHRSTLLGRGFFLVVLIVTFGKCCFCVCKDARLIVLFHSADVRGTWSACVEPSGRESQRSGCTTVSVSQLASVPLRISASAFTGGSGLPFSLLCCPYLALLSGTRRPERSLGGVPLFSLLGVGEGRVFIFLYICTPSLDPAERRPRRGGFLCGPHRPLLCARAHQPPSHGLFVLLWGAHAGTWPWAAE